MTVVTKGNRARAREDLRASIYAAAIGLFRWNGYAATSVDSIVTSAGVAKGTFFNFFPSKLDALKAYYREIDVEVVRVRRRLDPSEPSLSLRLYAEGVERILRREGALMIELLTMALHEPEMRRIDTDSGDIDGGEFAEFFREAITAGTLGAHIDPENAAAALIDLWSGAMRAWLVDPEKQCLRNLFDARVCMLFEGIGK